MTSWNVPAESMSREEWIKVLKDELRWTREHDLCPHGVPHANCATHQEPSSREDS